MHEFPGLTVKTTRLRALRSLGKVITAFVCLLLTGALLLMLSAVLLRMVGGFEAWQNWRVDHYWGLLAWRLTLYVGLAMSWLRLKRRLANREQAPRKPLWRIEVPVFLLVVLIELGKVTFNAGGAL